MHSDLDATQNLWDAMKEPIELREALSEEIGVDLRHRQCAANGLTRRQRVNNPRHTHRRSLREQGAALTASARDGAAARRRAPRR